MVLTGEYTWTQSNKEISIQVPLQGISPSNVDVDVSSLYIKINFRPYLIHIDLHDQVDDQKCLSRIEEGVLHLRCLKLNEREWSSLSIEEKDEAIIRDRRAKSVEAKRHRDEENRKKLVERKKMNEKLSTKLQMESDERERCFLEDLKNEEKRDAEQSVYDTLRELQKTTIRTEPKISPPKAPEIVKQTEVPPKDPAKEKSKVNASAVDLTRNDENKIFTSKDVQRNPAGDDLTDDVDLDKCIPAPRAIGTVKLSFTPRVFPSPMRESKREEEEDWLLRNKRHIEGPARKRLDAVDISERDPIWLKGKGDDFFKSQNYAGAINAYSCALEIDATMSACLSNRAACYLKINQYEKCVQDCDLAAKTIAAAREAELATAREMQAEPPKELRRTREMLKKVHIRKGTALKALEKYDQALTEYQLALEMDEYNPELKADCDRLTLLVQSNAQKSMGDASFREGNLREAVAHYSKGLSLNPESVACYTNRSTCYQKLDQVEEAISDALKALDLIDSSNAEWRIKLHRKLATQLLKVNRSSEAASQLRAILDLDPENVEIAKQLRLIDT